jgi:hypothetical protein
MAATGDETYNVIAGHDAESELCIVMAILSADMAFGNPSSMDAETGPRDGRAMRAASVTQDRKRVRSTVL